MRRPGSWARHCPGTCRPVLQTFSATVAHLGGAGTGQTIKLLNNTLLMANQKNIADIFDVAGRLGVDIPALIDVVRTSSGSSVALQAIGSSITTANAQHLSKMQLVDMEIFARAVAGLGEDVDPLNERAVEGAEVLPSLVAMASRSDPGSVGRPLERSTR
jgi:3-hydroxyisobutyrate dehydrogenase